jgi:hypothetical protein
MTVFDLKKISNKFLGHKKPRPESGFSNSVDPDPDSGFNESESATLVARYIHYIK